MKKKWKQIASFLLAAALLLGMIPALSVTVNAEANSGIGGGGRPLQTLTACISPTWNG